MFDGSVLALGTGSLIEQIGLAYDNLANGIGAADITLSIQSKKMGG